MNETLDPLIATFGRALRLYPWQAQRERWADRNERREEIVRMAAELVRLGAGKQALELWSAFAPADEPTIGPLRFL